jgi:DNA-binding MarR family transcriptional regulator
VTAPTPSSTTTITTPAGPPAPGPATAPTGGPAPDPPGAAAAVEPVTTATGESADTGSWEAPGEATARSGEGTTRNAHFKAARTAHGDRVAGDKVAGHKIVMQVADKTVPLREVPLDLTEPVLYAFVDPDNWIDLSTRFRSRRSAIVRGRDGRGKDACAIRLLTGEVDTIYQLDPDVDVTRLADSIADQAGALGGSAAGIGFLLCGPTHAGKLRAFTLQSLERALEATNARLVITLSADVHPADDELDHYVLELPDTPAPLERIVRSHLSWLCSDQAAARLVEQPTVTELIAELIAAEGSCRAAAELAAIISRERGDDDTVDGFRVRERQRHHQEQRFDLWFDGLRELDDRSFAVALAVLDGLPYEEVSGAARRLRRKLSSAQQLVLGDNRSGPAGLRVVREDRLQTPTARLLRTVRAAERDEERRFAYGMAPVRTVHYRDPDYPVRVIERIWRGYQIHPQLLEWLGELLLAPSEEVRMYAASALGIVAGFSFDYLCTAVLFRWANSKDRRLREGVAYAMLEAASDPRLAAGVSAVVTGWYANRQMPRLQATAARAYGVGVGSLDPPAVIDRLGRLALIDDFVVALAIGDALADLILQDPPRMAPLVCDTLLAWYEDDRRTRPAQLAFLILADSMVTWETGPDGALGHRWPSLLHLAHAVSALHYPLLSLWRRAIAESVLYGQAHDVLSGWAALAEHDTEQMDVFLRLLRATVQFPEPDERVRDIVLGLAGKWVDPEILLPLPRVHQEVLALLAPEGR